MDTGGDATKKVGTKRVSFPIMRSTFLTVLSLSIAVPFASAADYARDIQPLFAEHCLECHGPDKAKGGVNLTSRDSVIKPAKSGSVAVKPGDPFTSELIARVSASDKDEQMPPHDHKGGKRLKPHEIALLTEWIKGGAKYDLHWAYKPVVRPQTSDAAHPIDQFVRAKLAEKNITPSPQADAHTLVKRVYYDLIGLPPEPEVVEKLLHQSPSSHLSNESYERLVDTLLASPRFGERWGRHWLDAARFADSDGYEKDRPRPDAWRYRDWVIRAINDDMPFDQFTVEQLAGDLLPEAAPEQIVATAFNRQTLTNTEGGTDQEQFRIEACMDRIETVGAVWLGLTVGCARCHTHKYDQITHTEYFQMFAFFNNGDEVTKQVPTSPEAWSQYEKKNGALAKQLVPLQKALDAAKAALPEKLPEWEKVVQARLTAVREKKAAQTFAPLKMASVKSAGQVAFKALPDGSYLATSKQAGNDSYTVEVTGWDKPITALRIEALPDESLPGKGPGRSGKGNFVVGEVTARLDGTELLMHSAKSDYDQKSFKAAEVLDGKDETGWAIGGKTGEQHTLTLQLSEPIAPRAGAKLVIGIGQNYKLKDHSLGRFRVLAASEETEATIVPSDVLKILNEEPKRRNSVVIQGLWTWMEKIDPEVVAANRALEAAKAKLPAAPLMDVRVIGQRASNPRKTNLLLRGDFLQPADEVMPATLAVLPGMKAEKAGTKEQSRLDFARWLVSKDNPLTPRVTVNTIWGKLFGEGLVRTAADFGVRGERPTHPELLDWLVSEFMRLGWSRKKIIKTLLMSETYKQSSASARSGSEMARIAETDPKNTLLWRQNRLRVEGEIVRDLCLAASGLLSAKIGGPSVFPPMPDDIAALSYAGNFKWTASKGEDRYRRGLYTFFKRTAPHPDLTTFDCPDANLTNVKRTVSNTPLQALTTLNAEAFNEAAQAMSRRLLAEPLKNDDERIARCIHLCLARPAATREISALRRLLDDSRAYYKTSAEAAKEMTGEYALKDIPLEETAAWAATARIVLNMDEFITRE